MDRLITLGLLIVMVGAVGCGQAKPVAVEPAAKEVSESVKQKTQVVEKDPPQAALNSSVGLVATVTEGTAEATFRQTLTAFQEGRLDDAFDFLPPTYQADVDQLLHSFAAKMDTDVWSRSFDLLAKIAKVLKSKKNLILEMDGVKRLPQIESIKPHWDTIAGGISDLTSGELADLQRLKQASVRQLIGSGGGLLRGFPLPQFDDIQVNTVKSDAATTTLSYRETKTSEPKQVEFVLVEGKWLPKSIASGWSAAIADAQATLELIPERLASWKPVIIAQLDKVEGMIDQLQASRTKEEFGTAVAPLIFTMAYGAQMAQQAILESTTAARTGNSVHCFINRELNEDELTRLRDVFMQFSGDGGSDADYEMIPNDGKTRCRFTMVSDAEGLAAVLAKHFDKASVRLDLESRTIHIDFQ